MNATVRCQVNLLVEPRGALENAAPGRLFATHASRDLAFIANSDENGNGEQFSDPGPLCLPLSAVQLVL